MSERILFIGTPDDTSYAPKLRSIMADASVKVRLEEPMTLVEVELMCKKAEITSVVSTSVKLLCRLLPTKVKPSIDNYAGSLIEKSGITYVFIHPLKQLITVPYGQFLARRYCSKVTRPADWKKLPKFDWSLVTSENHNQVLFELMTADLISVDIETVKEPVPAIKCIGYTAVWFRKSAGKIEVKSYVLPIDSMFAVSVMRKLNYQTAAPKILQNGKYDIAYLLRYNAPLYNYMWDTASMMHCWYSELPKSLDAIASFFIRDSFYWKDLADTSDLHEYYKYNALDTWHTAMVALLWLLEAPAWAKKNYEMEFPLAFPCLLAEMTGIQRDMEKLEVARTEVDARITADQAKLERMTVAGFNPNSPPQVKKLLLALGCGDLKSTEEKYLKKAALRHPVNSKILNLILEIRGNRKLSSTYLVVGKELDGTILYSLTPWATDTGRLASREHAFWCGLQIQNIPRGKSVKQTLRAYAGFRLGECDLEQAESRDTAYISGDTALINAVESGRDFHSTNASSFFGVSYDKIYSDELHKTIDKVLRDLAKRVNHGASYNMQEYTLIDTMGEDKVWQAARILGLPKLWDLVRIAAFLLGQFHKTYPLIKGSYYPWVITTVETTHMLIGATGWTRYCFGNPAKNGRDLNALIAHNPQSLNAMKLNKAFMRVFYEVALVYPKDFRLCAQIHDSILFMFTEGMVWLAEMVRERMEIPITIKSTTGKIYTYTVPAGLKLGADGKGSIYWSDTE